MVGTASYTRTSPCDKPMCSCCIRVISESSQVSTKDEDSGWLPVQAEEQEARGRGQWPRCGVSEDKNIASFEHEGQVSGPERGRRMCDNV